MLDITLALIFSQLPHPECWMPRLPLEALNCFWLAFYLLGSWCSPGSRVCVVVEFVSRCSCYFCLNVIGLWQQRFQCTVNMSDTVVIALFAQDYHSSYCTFSSPSWLKPYWYSAHRLILIQMWCLQTREGRPLLFLCPFFSLCSLALNCYSLAVLSLSLCFSFPILLPSVSVSVFSGADSGEAATEQGIRRKKILCSIMFACHWDKIDEMLCLATDLRPDSQMGVERGPCQNRG